MGGYLGRFAGLTRHRQHDREGAAVAGRAREVD